MGFRYDFNKLPEKQVSLAYESDINELEKRLRFLKMMEDRYDIPEHEMDRIKRDITRMKMELKQLELEYELARF